jgi:hypothetical protein
MQLIVAPTGSIRCIYGETIDLSHLGQLAISRASHVEPSEGGNWLADLTPVGGPRLGPFQLRSDALIAEVQWLEANWLSPQSST